MVYIGSLENNVRNGRNQTKFVVCDLGLQAQILVDYSIWENPDIMMIYIISKKQTNAVVFLFIQFLRIFKISKKSSVGQSFC